MRRILVIAAAVSLVAAGCGGVDDLSFGKPPAIRAAVQAPSPPNLDSRGQGGVPGATTTTVPPIGPGGASIVGTVLGPSGPVGGATVEADRLVGNQVATTTVTTAADGSFLIGSILGGRYRVRAWQSPTLALTTPVIFFLGGTESHQVQLQLDSFTGPDVTTSINPRTVFVGEMANLVVQVTNPSVDQHGIVRDQPAAGTQVTLANGPAWTVYNGNPQTTAADGQVLFQVSCSSQGTNPLSVEIGSGAPQPIAVPDCVEPPPTTQCTPSGGTGGNPGFADTTTTTAPPNGGC